METFLAFGVLLALVVFLWYLVRWAFTKSDRKRTFRNRFLTSLALLVLLTIGFGRINDAKEASLAQERGFENVAEYKEAMKNNITSAEVWEEQKATLRAAEIAEQQKDAAAAQLAAEQQAANDQRKKLEDEAMAAREAEAAAFYAPGETQLAFLAAVDAARAASKSATNDLAKGGVRRTRRDTLCGLIGGDRIKSWSGRIYDLSTNGDGLGVLSINIGGDVYFKTWNNDLSDIGYDTLIDPSLAIFAKLSTLKKGDQVRFSGRLFRGRGPDCFNETSVTMSGSMSSPEFTMRFSEVRTYDQ